jgi:hypothetical protein
LGPLGLELNNKAALVGENPTSPTRQIEKETDMFVKVVVGRQQTVYECQRYTVTPFEGLDESGESLTMESDSGNSISLQFHKSKIPHDNAVVYIMNDQGKTIDTFYF